MTKFYTCVSEVDALEKLNENGTGLSWRDRYSARTFGGKIFTKEMFETSLRDQMKSRGNSLATQTITPTMVWKWWLKRGAIVELQ